MKVGHIAVSGPDDKRKTLIAISYLKNVRHCGANGTAACEYKLRYLAILADTNVEEIKTAMISG